LPRQEKFSLPLLNQQPSGSFFAGAHLACATFGAYVFGNPLTDLPGFVGKGQYISLLSRCVETTSSYGVAATLKILEEVKEAVERCESVCVWSDAAGCFRSYEYVGSLAVAVAGRIRRGLILRTACEGHGKSRVDSCFGRMSKLLKASAKTAPVLDIAEACSVLDTMEPAEGGDGHRWIEWCPKPKAEYEWWRLRPTCVPQGTRAVHE